MKKMIAGMMLLVGLAMAAGPLSLANPNPGKLAEDIAQTNYFPARESLYYYNAEANNAIGLTQGGTIHWAARFTINAAKVGTIVKAGVMIYVSGAPMPTTGSVNVYSGTTNNPGSPIGAGYTFGPVSTTSWQIYNCEGGLQTTDGMELWVYARQQHNAGQYPAAVDAGPCVVNYGCWVSLDGSTWTNLSQYNLNYNWDIFVVIETTDLTEGSGASKLGMKFATVGCGQTDIDYALPVSGPTNLTVYDMNGRAITLINEYQNAGTYTAMISGLRPGSYIVHLSNNGESVTRNLIVY